MEIRLKKSEVVELIQILIEKDQSDPQIYEVIYQLTDVIWQALMVQGLNFDESRKSIYLVLREAIYQYYEEDDSCKKQIDNKEEEIEELKWEYKNEPYKEFKKEIEEDLIKTKEELSALRKKQREARQLNAQQLMGSLVIEGRTTVVE